MVKLRAVKRKAAKPKATASKTIAAKVVAAKVVAPKAVTSKTVAPREARPKKSLHVEETGKRRYINVPADRARDLHAYLRNNQVRSAPPEPAYTGFDNIELAGDIDVNSVQALLNAWA